MADIERAASFYLGRQYDPRTRETLDEPVLYDARDLTTHGVVVGMTGSGKTGLCVDLLEEAALDGIPSIVIDPKGDMTNLLLTFPDLAPGDFEPWVNVDDARRKGLSVPEFAAATARSWAEGLAEWDESGERIRRLRESAEFVIYTPGSDAGVPVSVVQSLRMPDLSWDDDAESLRELIASTASALLGLVGVDADPVRSREHILISNIIEHAWRAGQDLDLGRLIRAVQKPPMRKLGVFDVDDFYPEKDRLQLAMMLNAVVASPSFENWLQGAPLDVAGFLHNPQGKPRVSIFYIAHLNDAERMFFVTLLLEQVLAWMRTQSGTTSLRCLVYMDEVFGYFPPHPANPPSKRPLLTLLKQARAFGVGVVLATQNPVDLDYKGLTNAGTWWVGKLQTDRDKARLLEGMEGVIAESGTMLDRSYLDPLISSLESRTFIMHNVHADRPILLKTRWALSYLRGPLTRKQVRELMDPIKARLSLPVVGPAAASATPAAATAAAAAGAPFVASAAPAAPALPGYDDHPPRVHARVPQYFLPITVAWEAAQRAAAPGVGMAAAPQTTPFLVYEPRFLGIASLTYGDRRKGELHEEQTAVLAPLPSLHGLVDWSRYEVGAMPTEDLDTTARMGAYYAPLPEGMGDSPPYTQLRSDWVEHIYRQHGLKVLEHAELKLTARPGESENEFRMRCREAARLARDEESARVSRAYDKELEQLRTKLEREEQELREDQAEHEARKRDEVVSAGETVLGLILGRRRTTGISKASQKRRMTTRAREDVIESEKAIAKFKAEIAELEKERDRALAQVQSKWADVAEQVRETTLRPNKADIRVIAFGLAWLPYWVPAAGSAGVPAYTLP